MVDIDTATGFLRGDVRRDRRFEEVRIDEVARRRDARSGDQCLDVVIFAGGVGAGRDGLHADG